MNKDLFKQITDWQAETFPNTTDLSSATHLQKETQELINAIKYSDTENIHEEIADCFFLLFDVAKKSGLDFNQISYQIQLKLLVNKSRIWNKPDADGCVHHQK